VQKHFRTALGPPLKQPVKVAKLATKQEKTGSIAFHIKRLDHSARAGPLKTTSTNT
jgi:hypothetical protein